MPVLAYPGFVAGVDNQTFEAAGKEIIEEALRDADVHGLEGRIDSETAAGGGASAVIDAAREATLVVVGSRGLSHAKEIVFGSVSHQVAHHAACPVVVVRAGSTGG
jgi:nucleotide-binding universal stress UspA family protein